MGSVEPNQWEASLSPVLPYCAWGGLVAKDRSIWNVAWHRHTMFELHILLDGSCNMNMGKNSFSMEAGTGIIIAPDTSHEVKEITSPSCHFSVSFSPAGHVEDSLSAVSTKGYHLFQADDDLIQLCRRVLAEIDCASYLGTEMVSVLLSQLIILCVREVKNTFCVKPIPAKTSAVDDEMEQIDRFFNFPPDQQTRKNLAEYLHCSERQLIRKFQKIYGTTFQQKLISHRIDYAKHLLNTTDKNLNEISTLVGYSDSTAFCRAFRQHTGRTPTQFRMDTATDD